MTFIKYLPTYRYCVVEDYVHELVAVEGKIELYEHFIKRWVAAVDDVPREILPLILVDEEGE